MSSPFEKDFDTILSEILTDYKNLDSQPDVGEGTMPFIMGSVLASMIWGLYRYQDYIAKQHFPDTADVDNLNHWGTVYDIARLDETDAEYLERILNFLRNPAAGGNANDFKTWALDTDECYTVSADTTYTNAMCTVTDSAFGTGTVGLYIVPNDETIVGDSTNEALRAATETYINSVRPLGMVSCSVISAGPTYQNVDMTVAAIPGSVISTSDISTAITDFMATLEPGELLYRSDLVYTAMSYNADYAIITTPSTETVDPGSDSTYIRAGSVNITEV
jgi:uncharacterized phage protein gp47/JayE